MSNYEEARAKLTNSQEKKQQIMQQKTRMK